jgi:hypothetical protein
MEVMMIKRLLSGSSVPVLALAMASGLAGPAVAQQAVANPAVASQPVANPAGAGGQAAPQVPAQRTITGRELMTPEERASFRRDMRQAAPEQQDLLWQQKRAELEQRAAQRGMVLAEAGAGPGGGAGEGRRRGRDGGRSEDGGWASRMLSWGPRAP